jgi:hypothetical protein
MEGVQSEEGDRREEGEQAYLNDVWSFYFHDPEDNRWTMDSYKRLGDVASVQDLRDVMGATSLHAHSSMFFAMREHVFPCWDDANNIDGGCVSIKVPMEVAKDTWETVVKRALGETLVVDDGEWAMLNGVSISPKRGFCIVKLWMADTSEKWMTHSVLRLPEWYRGHIVFRINRDNMQMDANKVVAAV